MSIWAISPTGKETSTPSIKPTNMARGRWERSLASGIALCCLLNSVQSRTEKEPLVAGGQEVFQQIALWLAFQTAGAHSWTHFPGDLAGETFSSISV